MTRAPRVVEQVGPLVACGAVVALALLLHSGVARAQAPAAAVPRPPVLTPEALREDVRILRLALDSIHPGTFRYTSRVELDRRVAQLEQRLARAGTLPEAFLAFSEFTSTLHCAHTFPNPNNQPRVVAEAVFRNTPRVPFLFRWIETTMVVTHDESAERLFPPGTEVMRINGLPSERILASLMPYSRTDGGNLAKRVANLNVIPGKPWQAFDVHFPLLFTPPAGEWRFLVRRPGEATATTVRAAPVTAARRAAAADSARRSLTADATTPPWRFAIGDDGIGVLTMPTWTTYNDRWDWQGFIRRAFQELDARQAKALVIDLRGNEGGTSVGDVILRHLVERDVTLAQFRRYTRYGKVNAQVRPFLDTWDRTFDDWGTAATAAAGRPGFYRMRRYDGDSSGTVVRATAPRFGGRVFALVDASNSSATFEFALALRDLRLGTLVGGATGGNRRGINGGAFYFLRLPNSQVEIDLPLIGFFPDQPQPDAGLMPDVPVTYTAADIATGRDPAVLAVRRIVAEGAASTTGGRQ